MVNGESTDPATAETAAGAGSVDSHLGESAGEGSEEFVVDPDADPPQEVQPTTS